MTLEDAIAQFVNLGEKDPVVIARKLIEREDEEWLGEQLRGYAEDLIADMARRRLGSVRRSAQLALRPGDELTSAQMKIVKAWVPGLAGGEWKRASELTPEDLDAQAKWYESLAGAVVRRAMWCRQVAAMIRSEDCGKLGKLKATLPALPDPPEELAA